MAFTNQKARFGLRSARAALGPTPSLPACAGSLKTGEVLPVAWMPSEVRRRVSRKRGGPARGFEVAASDAPPLHLFLGADAYDMANQKIEQVQSDLSAWQAMATATDVD